jgi:hypothetical protein
MAIVLAVTALAAAPSVSACGDKFLVPIRGTRFQRPSGPRPHASILVFAHPSSGLPQALKNIDVEAVLTKVGYRPSVVSDDAALKQALDRGGWDVVLAAGDDVEVVQAKIPEAAPPVILPVLYDPTKAELAKAKSECTLVVKAPTKNQAFLDAVDEAVDFHARSLRAKPRK